jgi:hypothetical protein
MISTVFWPYDSNRRSLAQSPQLPIVGIPEFAANASIFYAVSKAVSRQQSAHLHADQVPI